MLFYRQKKKEQTDQLHHEYGLLSNCGYIMRAFLRYRKSTIAYLFIGGIAGASMSYIWTIIAKLVIDMITRQAGAADKDVTPLLWLVVFTTVVEFIIANCEYPGEWDGVVERIETLGGLTVTVTHVYPKDRSCSFHVVSFLRTENDRIVSLDEYWADDGCAPQWRLDKHIGTPIERIGE